MVEVKATTKLVNDQFSDVLLNRKSVRKFDPSIKISRDEIKEMIKEATSAPSACNLQSWYFAVLDQPEAKNKVRSEIMKFNLKQFDSASAVIFLLGDTKSHEKYRDLWNRALADGKITEEKRDEIFKTFLPLYENASRSFLEKDATVDVSMAAMQLLLCARAHGYEANVFAGYNADTIVKTLGLDDSRYVPVVAIAIGKAAEKPIESDRYPVDELIKFV